MGWYYEFYNKNTEEKIYEGKLSYAPWMKYEANNKYNLKNITFYEEEMDDSTIFIDKNSKIGKALFCFDRGYTMKVDVNAIAFDIESAIKMDKDIVKNGGNAYLEDLFINNNTNLIIINIC